jgi:hypothetical protein
MAIWRALGTALLLTVTLAACSGGDDSDSAGTTAVDAATTGPTTVASTADTTAATTAVATSAPPSTGAAAGTSAPTTGAANPTTTVDEASTGEPAPVKACELLTVAQIETVLGGPVSEPIDLETSCEWTIGDSAAGVSDTLTLTLEGTADGLADTRDLLGDAAVDVEQAGDGGVYWADFTTLYFTKDGRLLSLQFLAPGADDPLSGLVALANQVA